MRGGKRGQHKGRERVLAENEDDIIARNMMVRVLQNNDGQEREEKKKRRDSDEEESEENESSSEANESESEPDREEIMRNMPVEEVMVFRATVRNRSPVSLEELLQMKRSIT